MRVGSLSVFPQPSQTIFARLHEQQCLTESDQVLLIQLQDTCASCLRDLWEFFPQQPYHHGRFTLLAAFLPAFPAAF